jgi:glycosyltransferase involved in cell wall biosynthesis
LLDDIDLDTRDVHLLLAGPHEAEVKAKLAEPPFAALLSAGRIHSIDRFLDENEMLMVAEASDLVLAAYLNHSGRSSIILWAGAAGKPVIGADRGTIHYVIHKERLGATCNVRDASEFVSTMRLMLDSPWNPEDAQRVREHAQWHRIENYQQLSSELVRSRLENTLTESPNTLFR